MTQVILIKRIPFTLVKVAAGWLVFKILAAFVYTENDRKSLPRIPENDLLFKS
jgi:hypothetical protein